MSVVGGFIPVSEGSCQVHRDCDAVLLNLHHIPPVSWKPKTTSTIRVCPNAHVNIHAYMDAYLEAGGNLKAVKARNRWGRKTRAFALMAFSEATKQGLTPARTL